MNLLTFNIKTTTDIDGCRHLYDLHGLSDDDVATAALFKMRQQKNTEVLPHHLQKIVAISAVLRTADQFKVWSLGAIDANEADLLQRFYNGVARYTPSLITWNGLNFHLPVLHYRSLLYPIVAEQYWRSSYLDNQALGDNSLNRQHQKHTDLLALLTEFQPAADIPLNELAALCGFPNIPKIDIAEVWACYQSDKITDVRHHCEAEVLNTYLVYLNHRRNCGEIEPMQYQTECKLVRENLINSDQPHLIAFEKAWLDQQR